MSLASRPKYQLSYSSIAASWRIRMPRIAVRAQRVHPLRCSYLPRDTTPPLGGRAFVRFPLNLSGPPLPQKSRYQSGHQRHFISTTNNFKPNNPPTNDPIVSDSAVSDPKADGPTAAKDSTANDLETLPSEKLAIENMDISRTNFADNLPEIIEAINNSYFVSFDLELSGIHRAATSKNPTLGRRQTLQERYKEVKEAAERFQVLQFGLCIVTYSKETGNYVLRPYNFNISPITDPKFGLDREYTVQAGALEFLAENGFNFNSQLMSGVPYLSHEEEKWIIEREDRLGKEQKEDIHIDDQSKQFVADFMQEIQDWVDDPNPLYDFLNISTSGQTINGYQKRLVHQLVRAKFPNLTTLGKSTFVQVIKNDPAADKLKREERRARFDKDLQKGIGMRYLIDALLKSKKPLVGHNLITDLVNLYRCFIGPLPETAKEFAEIINSAFPIVLDTKYLATCTGDTIHFGSGLQYLWDSFTTQKTPAIELHIGHTSYSVRTHAHEAGYDAFDTARVLLKIAGRYHSYLQALKKEGDTDAEEKAALKLMDYIHRPDKIGEDAKGIEVHGLLPEFNNGGRGFWGKWVNKLRVNGTAEGEFVLGG